MNPNNENKNFEIDGLGVELPKPNDSMNNEESNNPTYDTLNTNSDTLAPEPIESKQEPTEEPMLKPVEKPEKEKKPKGRAGRAIRRIVNLIIWIAVLGIIAVWVTDFVMVQQEKEPKFCISKKTIDYTDGNVEECVGLGYKVLKYNRTSYKATEFGPFFIEIKDN